MERTELLTNVRDALINAGFYVSDLHPMRITGFDVMARRDDSLLIIKVMTNIDSISENVANELKTLSSLLKGCPLLIGEKNGSGRLEDDVVYFRFGVQVITINTLRNHLLEGMPIKVYAAPGGLYVHLDELKLRELRHEKGISLGTLARHVNVSRRTVRMYEEGMNSRIEVAHRMEKLLEQSITIPINILKTQDESNEIGVTHHGLLENIKSFQKEVFSLLQNVGYKIIPMERCPFEALSKDREKILLTCVHKYNNKLLKKAQIVSSISKITEKHAVVFTDKDIDKRNVEGTPVIVKKELKKLRDPEEVFELIIERI
ncbi:MAG: transcriptional regulator [Thermoplasmatales archaeon]|nr:MAG: transcriptional regulator [Thermoplasmatales archaeon]